MGYLPAALRIVRLLVETGPRQFAIRPFVSTQKDDRRATAQAMRAGRRLYPGKLVAVECGTRLVLNLEWHGHAA